MTPQIAFQVWLVFFVLLFTALNLLGIRASARTTQALVIAMGAVIVAFFVAAARYVVHLPALHPSYFTQLMVCCTPQQARRHRVTCCVLPHTVLIG